MTNEVTGATTNAWTYDEAGTWLNASPDSKWVYNADNEIAGRLPTATPGVTNITVTGQVEPVSAGARAQTCTRIRRGKRIVG